MMLSIVRENCIEVLFLNLFKGSNAEKIQSKDIKFVEKEMSHLIQEFNNGSKNQNRHIKMFGLITAYFDSISSFIDTYEAFKIIRDLISSKPITNQIYERFGKTISETLELLKRIEMKVFESFEVQFTFFERIITFLIDTPKDKCIKLNQIALNLREKFISLNLKMKTLVIATGIVGTVGTLGVFLYGSSIIIKIPSGVLIIAICA